MSDKKCPFCGSKDIVVETPYIDRVTQKPKTTICCKAQRNNSDYREKRYGPVSNDQPSAEEVSKL